MGTFGPGPLDNDVALDFLSEVQSRKEVSLALTAVSSQMGDDLDADVAQRALAAAEVVAFGLGRGRPGTVALLPETVKALDVTSLAEKARHAVSGVLLGGELLELWAEGDPSEFNVAVSDLISRLNPDVPYTPEEWDDTDNPAPRGPLCCFCHQPISGEAPVQITFRIRHDIYNELDQDVFAHVECVNARMDPRHLVQSWVTKIED